MSTRVVHVRDGIPGAVYIGRSMPRQGLVNSDRRLLAQLPELRGKALACWCRHDGEERTPDNACHGDVLVDLLDRYTDDELRAMAQEEVE